MIWKVIFASLLALLAGCSPKPDDDSVRQVLEQHLPRSVGDGVVVQEVQSEMTADGDSVLVKFKAQLRATQPFYVPVEFEEVSNTANANKNMFAAVDRAVQGLSAQLRQEFQVDVQKLSSRPVFIQQRTPSGSLMDWYGSYRAKKVVDRWVVNAFTTDVDPVVRGKLRSAYPSDALEAGSADSWFTEMERNQQSFLQRVSDAQKLEHAQEQLAEARSAAEEERAAREQQAFAAERQARQLPINVQLRRALIGNTFVLRMTSLRPITVTVQVSRGAQHFARDLQLTTGRPMELGHLEGWGFRTGDLVEISNSLFDPKAFRVQ